MKITDLIEKLTQPNNSDYFIIRDTAAGATKKISYQNINPLSQSGVVTPDNMTGVKMAGLGTTLVGGSAPPLSTAFKIQGGTGVGSTGNNTVTFPTAFPNGLLTVVATNGDSAANAGNMYLSGSAYALTGFQIASTASGSFRYNWLAIGW